MVDRLDSDFDTVANPTHVGKASVLLSTATGLRQISPEWDTTPSGLTFHFAVYPG